MLLRDNLYHVIVQDDSSFTIRFNAQHPVFAGHFPGHPIVPGACLVQIAEDLLSEHLNRAVTFTAIHNLKFRQPVYPDHTVTYELKPGKTENTINCQLSIINSLNASFTASYMCPDTDL